MFLNFFPRMIIAKAYTFNPTIAGQNGNNLMVSKYISTMLASIKYVSSSQMERVYRRIWHTYRTEKVGIYRWIQA